MTRWRLIKALLAVSAIAIVGLGVAAGVAAARDSGSSNDATVRVRDGDSSGTAWLGILGDTNEDPAGVRIVHVFENSAAADAGLERNDVITAIDGNEVADLDGFRDAIDTHSPGDEVTLDVIKDGEGDSSDVVVTLQEHVAGYDLLGDVEEFPRHFGGGILDGLKDLFPDGFDAFLDGSFRYRDDNGDVHEVTTVAGTITDISADSITIDTNEGDSLSFDLTDDTHVPDNLESDDTVIIVSLDSEVTAVIAPGRLFDNIGIPDFHFDFDDVPFCDDESTDDRPEGLHDLICEGKFDFRIPEHCDDDDSSADDPRPDDESALNGFCTGSPAIQFDRNPMELFCNEGRFPFPAFGLFDEERIRDEYCD